MEIGPTAVLSDFERIDTSVETGHILGVEQDASGNLWLASRDGLTAPNKSLNAVYSAGATLPAPVAEMFFERFGIHVGQLYGATEIGSVTFGRPEGDALPEGCVGRPMNGVSIEIVGLEDVSETPAPGEQGQIAIQAPSMLEAYLGNDTAPIANGHFLTGDLGSIDRAGALTITGRVKTLIEVGGMKVNPMEVERALGDHPGVAECAVVPVLVTQTLSRVTAFIVPTNPHQPPSASVLRGFVKPQLATYKVPRAFNIVEALPKTSLGKVKRRQLMESGT